MKSVLVLAGIMADLLGAPGVRAADTPAGRGAPAFAVLPTQKQLVQTYPVEARKKRISGEAKVTCYTAAEETEQPWPLQKCDIVAESPTGRGFGASAKIAGQSLFAFTADTKNWPNRSVTITFSWKAARSASADTAGFVLSDVTPFDMSTFPPPRPLPPVIHPNGSPPPTIPIDAQLATLGPCVWTSIGAEGQSDYVDHIARKTWADPLTYRVAWEPILNRCDPETSGSRYQLASTARLVTRVYLAARAREVILESEGISRALLAKSWHEAPLKVVALFQAPLGMSAPRSNDVKLAPLFQSLGIGAPGEASRLEVQSTIVAYYRDQALYESALAGDSYRVLLRPSRLQHLASPPAGDPISHPNWALEPSRRDLARFAPQSWERGNTSAEAELDCLIGEGGWVEACFAPSDRGKPEDVDVSAEIVAECCYRLPPTDQARRVQLDIVWPQD